MAEGEGVPPLWGATWDAAALGQAEAERELEEHPVVDTVEERERVAQADVEKLGAGVEHRVGEGVLVLDTERACGMEWA